MIGRDRAANITIDDQAASRFHAKLLLKKDGWRIVDLESSNGTFLNGDPIRDVEFAPGDQLGIGDSELRLEAAIPTTTADGGQTQILKTIEIDPNPLDGIRSGEILAALHAAAPLLGSSSQSVVEEGLQHLVKGTKADRGAILLQEKDGWSCRCAWSSRGLPMHGFVLSHTIHTEVMQTRRAVLSRDTSQDPRFSDRRSVVGDEIRTVIAAPILIQEGLRGLLYLDRIDGISRPFGDEELWGASVAAGIVGAGFSIGEELDELTHDRNELVRTVIDSMPIIGNSAPIEQMRIFIRKAAPTGSTVLVRGETGTGKELVARAIHYQGSRAAAPFVALNCAAIPATLVESELFGHEKGSFTGADQSKEGKFEAADGGTVFLDEIGELPAAAQSKMLRLLEEKRLERVGSNESIAVDVRIVAATHRDLQQEVANGRFREDLYYRLAVLEVVVPPLRDRIEDIDMLTDHFLDLCSEGKNTRKSISRAGRETLRKQSWPGNVRQLKNVIESAVILSDGEIIGPNELRLNQISSASGSSSEPKHGEVSWKPIPLRSLEEKHIEQVLEHVHWNKKKAAELLGIERSTLYSRIRNMKLEPPQNRSGEGPGADQ